MKKGLSLLLALCMLAVLLTGCGKEEPASLKENIQQKTESAWPETQEKTEEPPKEQPDKTETAGERYDAGNITVLVPEGWKAFPDLDVFSEEEGATNPDVLNVSKGGQSDMDLFTKPYVRIAYSGPSVQMLEPDADWYEDVEELDPIITGEHEWSGFSCKSMGVPLTILWCEEGSIQYQATLSLGSDGDTISHQDADVQAILASVQPSDGASAADVNTAPAAPKPVKEDSFWNGQWYGWWCVKYASGNYETFDGIAWDLYAVIEDYGDGSGYLTLWDTETTRARPLVRGDVNFDSFGVMTSCSCTFYDGGEWLPNVVTVQPKEIYDWYVDPKSSSVSHFENMIEIEGFYEDPNNDDNYFTYYMYLRPWGTDWEDVRNGDTSGCIYNDMMPVIYDDWYVPLLNLGVTELPDCIDDGFALINGGASVEAEPYDGEPGKMGLEELKEALAWAKSNQSYDNTYAQIADGFGVPGLFVDEFKNNGKVFCRYRWFADDDNRVTITFEKQADGTLTWNITAWDGLK